MKKMIVATIITTLMVFGLSAGASSVRAQTLEISKWGAEAYAMQKADTKIGHERIKAIQENFQQNKDTLGRATPPAVGTIGVSFAVQEDWSCCNSMNDDSCPIVQQLSRIDPERVKAVEKHFQENKDTLGGNSAL